ncbi:MAG TPA: YidC/Oxa1 family membrane protein insertase [Gaiellaceae bacterium]|nr:YidC/Oxa1 family membrane protein insertase [Gaiellaceae bacterium]
MAASPLQPLEPRRRRLPREPALILGGILSPLENALAWGLEHLHDTVGFSWGWSIVALTVIVRVAIVPVMVKQIHSMQAMQMHMPEMKAIQQRYKGDRQRLNEELMKFYKENNINPAASCLPLLLQIPVFIALYFVLNNFTKHVTAQPDELGWLIVPNITHKITSHWSGWLLLVLYVASQVGYAYFGTPPNIPKSQRVMFMVLPFFITPFIIRFPVGLLMYWMTTNLWTVGQGIITRRMVPKPEPPPKRSSRTAPKPAPAEDGGDRARAEPEPQRPRPAATAGGPPRRVKRKKKRTRR